MSVQWISGDVFDGLATLDDASVDERNAELALERVGPFLLEVSR